VPAPLVAFSALTWVILVPAVGCWPVAGYVGWRVWQWSKRHEAEAEAERHRLLEAAAHSAPPNDARRN
jgi:hypothetical protein